MQWNKKNIELSVFEHHCLFNLHQVPKFYWSQRGWPVRSDIQKDACEKIKFTPTIRLVTDMHAMSGYAGDDGPNSIYCEQQV